MMNACAKEVDFLQMQGECAWLKMHVKACELNGCGWKCGCNDEVNACGMDAKGIRLGNDGVFLW